MDGIEHPARLTVGVVGAGRVGAVLGAALARAGHRVTGAYAVSDASRSRAAELLPGVPLADVATVVAGAELVLLAVPDDALRAPRRAGCRRPAPGRPARWRCTPAAGTGSPCSSRRGAHHVLPLALHPAMTFTGTAMDLDRLTECAFGVTTDEALRPVAEALVLEMGGDPVWVAEEDRAAYHAALAHGANHLVTLTSEAMELLVAGGGRRAAPGRRPADARRARQRAAAG